MSILKCCWRTHLSTGEQDIAFFSRPSPVHSCKSETCRLEVRREPHPGSSPLRIPPPWLQHGQDACLSGEKTARTSLFRTLLVKVKVRRFCDAQSQPPPPTMMMMMVVVKQMHKLRQKRDSENTEWRECKDGALGEREVGLSCRLSRRDRAGPPKREGSGLSGRTQAALLAEAARRGRGCCCWSVTASSPSPLSPSFSITPPPIIRPKLMAFLLCNFHLLVSLHHNLLRLLKSNTIQCRSVE